MQIDIGFGDTITPSQSRPLFQRFSMAGTVAAGLSKETVVAEKFEAMVKLGMANSRMKDFTICAPSLSFFRSMERFLPRRS